MWRPMNSGAIACRAGEVTTELPHVHRSSWSGLAIRKQLNDPIDEHPKALKLKLARTIAETVPTDRIPWIEEAPGRQELRDMVTQQGFKLP